MNRPIVTLPSSSGGPTATTPAPTTTAGRAEPPPEIATPTPTSVDTYQSHAALLDVAAALRGAEPTVAADRSGAAEAATTTDPVTAPTEDVTGPSRPRPSLPATPVRPDGLSIGPAQIICWQLSVVAVGVALGARVGLAGTIATVGGALALVVVSTVRVRGTWLHQWLGVGCAYALRRRRTELPQNADAATALLGLWLGETGIEVELVRERPMTLISHRSALGALLRLDTSVPRAVGEALAGLLRDDGAILAAVDEQQVDLEAQLVVHGAPQHDREPVAWLAVAAHRHVGLSTDEQLSKVLKNAVRRVQRQLDRAGAGTTPLDRGEAAATVVALAHADAGRGHLHERWSALSAGPVTQACLRLDGFTRLTLDEAEALLGSLLSGAPGTAVTFSVGARLARGRSNVQQHDPVLRVAAASPGALELAITVLGRVASGYRLRAERLDGRHGPATAASLPIGRSQV